MVSRVCRTCLIFHRFYLVMLCVIITNLDGIFRIPTWLEDNLPSFVYFRKIALTASLRKTRRGKESSPNRPIYLNSHTHRPWRTTSTIQTNKRGAPPCFHSHSSLVLGHVLIHSVDKTHVLVITVELIWLLFFNLLSFNFFATPNKSLRFTRFRRSYANRPTVTVLFCLMYAAQSGHLLFLQLFVPNDITFA